MVNTVANSAGVNEPMSADQEFQAGFYCVTRSRNSDSTSAQRLPGIAVRFYARQGARAPGTENDDHNPPRIQQRNLFDLALGDDNLLHGDKYKWSAQFTVINLANNYGLYNFLSTFSGTHYVTPRSYTAQLGFHF